MILQPAIWTMILSGIGVWLGLFGLLLSNSALKYMGITLLLVSIIVSVCYFIKYCNSLDTDTDK